MASFSSTIQTTTSTDGSRAAAARSSDGASSSTLDGTRPSLDRAGDVAAEQATTDAGRPSLSRAAPTPQDPSTRSGIIVPGDFRGVDVRVVDPEGEPLTEVAQLLVLYPFPVSTQIDDDGVGKLPLLKTVYSQFRGLVPKSESLGFEWYEAVEGQQIDQFQDEAVIALKPSYPGGTNAGAGVDFGL